MGLTAKQRRAAGLLARGDMTQKEVAEAVRVHPATLRRWNGNEEYAREKERAVVRVLEELLQGARQPALSVLIGQLGSQSESVAQKAALELLNRAGLTGVHTLQPARILVRFDEAPEPAEAGDGA